MQEAPPGRRTHFGSQTVPLEEKQRLVDGVFRKVARRYDLMNDLMSGGLHRAWKRAVVTAINPPRNDRGFLVADIAGGTGDIAFRIIGAGGAGVRVTVADVSPEMAEVGRARAIERGVEDLVRFVVGNAESLPLSAATQDAVSIAFGMRNVSRYDRALAEAYRVLKFGGQFVCLEFSDCDVPWLDAIYDVYSFRVIPLIGRTVVGDAEPYRYLVESIRKFPAPESFAAMMEDAGFRRVSYRQLFGGIVALHSGWRL
jgi:demethylmenaquinone methyltransferase/2-methoxy-6-polyprenyl-1,4-benzoquinol methylase